MSYWTLKLAPTKYCDDVYHVGSQTAPCYLINSTDGIILLDTGMPKTLYQILLNIKEIGFDYRDIKHIIHSHGHIDHIGGTRALVELTGAKTYIGKGDEDTVSGRDGLQYTNEFNMRYEEPFEPDFVLNDGDRVVIGNKKFDFVSTPGHTKGTMSIFFNASDKGRDYRAGTFGGGGLNTMSRKYLERYGLPLSLRDDFIKSIEKVYNSPVELHIGNHLGDNKHNEKILHLGEEKNPFLDGSTWKWFLDKRKAEALAFFENDK
ncbi:MAG: MBL fold metallo-hydrolase [Ruminococcaceae bacterium]|nr:MBL fold metallo-hydrolase [Oscillospiraceae bacterium]